MKRCGLLVAGLVAVSAGCSSDGAILSAGGRGRSFRIEPEDTEVLVGAPGAGLPDRIRVRVSPLSDESATAEGREVRFRVEAGAGRLLQDAASADADGVASVGYLPAATVDSTVVRAFVADDPGAAILLRVLARPAVSLEGTRGAVLGLPRASSGVLLAVPAGATVDLVPYSTSPSRGGLRYLLRHDRGIFLDPGARAGTAPALAPGGAPPPEVGAGREDAALTGTAKVVAAIVNGVAAPGGGPALGGGLAPGGGPASGDGPALESDAGLPPALDVASCRLDVHRLAPLARAGRTVALYVDALEPPDPARLDELVQGFDSGIAPVEDALFGPPTDLDRNGRVLVVMSRSMPPDGGVFCGSLRRLGREIFYTAWDPSTPLSVQLRILAHEYQHILNASQHLRHDRIGLGSDLSWLNEGLSHVAEWKAGYPDGDLLWTLIFLGRVNAALPLLAERDGSDFAAGRFLFALYLGDRFGDGIYRALGESGLAGRPNVESVTGLPFRDLLRDWFVALALGDDPPSEPAWRYRSIELAGEETRVAACQCLPASRLPGVAFERLPVESDAAIVRTLDVQDADFFRVTAGERPVALYFQAGGESDAELFAVRR